MRYHLVRFVIAGAMIAGMLLSQKLWLTERTFPHAPVWDGLPTIPAPWDKAIFGAMLLSLALAAVLPWPRLPLLGFVALAGIWSLWDQSRWQPWFYQYFFMLFALGMSANPERREGGLNACRFILATTYFWSGLQKVSFGFATDIYPWMLEPILKNLSEPLRGWIADQGWIAAFTECTLGAMLLVWPLRMIAVPLLIAMHGVILYCLSPRGHDWNTVVWPWNIAMMVLIPLLFVNTKKVMPWHIVWPRRYLLAPVTLVLFGIMPVFSFYDCWDAYLSASLYSGNTIDGHIFVSEEVAENLPLEVRANYVNFNQIDLMGWSMAEMNVPDYPARRVYRAVVRKLGPSGGVILDVEEAPNWRTGERTTTREKLVE